MKSKIITFLVIGLVTAMPLISGAADTKASASLSILKSVPLAELPGKAAALVATADVKNQTQTTVDVVKSAIGLNPAAAPAVVGSVAAGTPEAAAVAAATAATLLPKQAALLAQTAAAAAPKYAGKIVEAVCSAVPSDYKAIAQAVASAVPGAAKEILSGVAAAIPSLKGAINQALAVYKNPSVNVVLSQVAAATAINSDPLSASEIAAKGHGGAPINPPPATPTPLDPGAGGQVPDGGRVYSNPTGGHGS